MPQVDSATPGHFVWIELATNDTDSAKRFYTSLFGWTTREHDMGEMGTYYIFRKNGRDAAAMYALPSDQQAHGVAPSWMTYIAVTSADEAVARAESLGAKTLQPPFDVFDFGRMAVLHDPEGAVFAVWEPKSHWGVGVRDEEGTLCWNELATHDPDRARSFYTSLAGWSAKISPGYTEWYSNSQPIGGMRTINEGEPTPPNWMPYFMVTDVDDTVARVAQSGGTVHVPATDIAGVGRFSVVGDPRGAVFALFKSGQ